jgi:uncharacterized protein
VREEVQPLLKKAAQSLDAARLLRQEDYLDFAASRAYYAMFYAAEALPLDRGLSFSSHAAVIAAFGRLFARTGALDAKYHRYLIDGQDARNLGDYGVGAGVSANRAEEMLSWAEEFIAAAQQLLE